MAPRSRAIPIITPDSATGQELGKWETPKREGGLAPDGYEPYPRMLYQARKLANGTVVCYDENDPRKGVKIVRSEREERIAKGQGWYESPGAALAGFEADEIAIGDAAAEAAHAAQRMTS